MAGKEYIERDYILRTLASMNYPWIDFEDAYEIVQNAPSADVTEVVRCKDCRYSKFIKTYSKYMCDKYNGGRGELKYSNDFCSDGKRKTD